MNVTSSHNYSLLYFFARWGRNAWECDMLAISKCSSSQTSNLKMCENSINPYETKKHHSERGFSIRTFFHFRSQQIPAIILRIKHILIPGTHFQSGSISIREFDFFVRGRSRVYVPVFDMHALFVCDAAFAALIFSWFLFSLLCALAFINFGFVVYVRFAAVQRARADKLNWNNSFFFVAVAVNAYKCRKKR